jgi:hypothetical protein
VTEKDLLDDSTLITRMILTFTGKDIYGNLMSVESICSYFTHNRFILFFNIVFKNPNPLQDLQNIKINMYEDYVQETSLKNFTIDVLQPKEMTFESIFLNYTMLDGINYKNGILIKYYSNNNF